MTEVEVRARIEAKVERRAWVFRALAIGHIPALSEELAELDASLRYLWETLRWVRAGARILPNVSRDSQVERRLYA